jgi:hypothetical protein
VSTRALGNPGRAAGVLQERDILVIERHGLEVLELAVVQRLRQRNGAGQRIVRHEPAHVAHDEVHQRRFWPAQQIAEPRDNDRGDIGVRDDFCERVREVLEYQDRPRAGILQLVVQLARGVQRVGVDDRQARAERGHERDRVLEHVREHHREAITLLEPGDSLQIGRKLAAEPVEVAIGERPVHARERRAIGPSADCLLDDILQRAELVRIDRGRTPGG